MHVRLPQYDKSYIKYIHNGYKLKVDLEATWAPRCAIKDDVAYTPSRNCIEWKGDADR